MTRYGSMRPVRACATVNGQWWSDRASDCWSWIDFRPRSQAAQPGVGVAVRRRGARGDHVSEIEA